MTYYTCLLGLLISFGIGSPWSLVKLRAVWSYIFNLGEVFLSQVIMDPEDRGNDAKAPLDTVAGAANNEEDLVPPKAAATAQAVAELHTENGPDVFDGIEGQIALDSFLSGGSERPLMELLARVEGLNVDDCVLRSPPWELPAEGDGAQFEFLGAVDQLVDPNDHYGSLSHTIKPQLRPGAAQVHNREISNEEQ